MPSRLPGSGLVDTHKPVTSGVTVSRRKTGRFSNLYTPVNSTGVRMVTLGVFSDLPSASMAGAGGTRIGLGASEVAGRCSSVLQGTAAAGVGTCGGATEVVDVVRM